MNLIIFFTTSSNIKKSLTVSVRVFFKKTYLFIYLLFLLFLIFFIYLLFLLFLYFLILHPLGPGARAGDADQERWSQLSFMSAQNEHLEVVKALLEAGGRELVMLTENNGTSCLYVSAGKGHLEVVKALLELGGRELLTRTMDKGTAFSRGRRRLCAAAWCASQAGAVPSQIESRVPTAVRAAAAGPAWAALSGASSCIARRTVGQIIMMMPFNCSYRNKNEPTAIYPSLGYSPPGKKIKHV